MMPIDRRSLLGLSIGLFSAVMVGDRKSFATPTVKASLRVVLASKVDGSSFTDPKLSDMAQLKAAPFDGYNSFELLDDQILVLSSSKPASLSLVNGRILSLTLMGDHDGRVDEHGHGHYRIRAQIASPGRDDYLKKLEVSASAHEPFFLAGQAYRGGVLLLAITIHE